MHTFTHDKTKHLLFPLILAPSFGWLWDENRKNIPLKYLLMRLLIIVNQKG